MNSSKLPDSIEEKWTAYLDGRMRADEAAVFEREHPEASGEKAAMERISRALRMHSPAPALRNAEFFNQEILREVASKQPRSEGSQPRASLWSLWRMALAGACSLLMAAGIYAVFVSGNEQRPERYVAQILSVKTDDDDLDATVLDADGLAVVWIDGLDELPNEYVLQ